MASIINKFAKRAIKILMKIDPSLTEEEIRRAIDESVEESYADPDVIIKDGINEDKPSTLSKFFEWVDNRIPIISGNATFFVQHKERLSPVTKMIEKWKKLRSYYKKEMYKYEPGSDKYRDYDKRQRNCKANMMNAYYGILAVMTCRFFNIFNPPTITGACRNTIATAMNLFESLLGDNMSFLNMNDFLDWQYRLLEYKTDVEYDKWLTPPTQEMVVNRIADHFKFHPTNEERTFIEKYVRSLTKRELVAVYYANNLMKVIEHAEVQTIINRIFHKIPSDIGFTKPSDAIFEKYKLKYGSDEYNAKKWKTFVAKEKFYNPYSMPSSISDDMKKFLDICMRSCYVQYLPTDAVTRALTFQRKCVIIMDTDSNMLYVGPLVNSITSMISEKCMDGLKDSSRVIITNMIAALATDAIADTQHYLMTQSNSSDDYNWHIAMKNEFYYSVMMIAPVKKRYFGKILVQEGNLLDPPRFDIKGFDFKKSAVPKIAENRMSDIVKKYIMNTEPHDVPGMIREVDIFRTEIKETIDRGEMTYLKLATFKLANAYKNPERIQVWKGGMLWNTLYPDKKISNLNKVRIAKLTTPMGIGEGLPASNVIAIPETYSLIPEDLRPYIDTETIVTDIISSFGSVLEAFGVVKYQKKIGAKKVEQYSNIVQL
jgi:hypothetical protein